MHKEIGKATISLSSIGTLANGNKYSTFIPSNKNRNYNDGAFCNIANYVIGGSNVQNGQFYENIPNFVFVGTDTDTLESMKSKYNGGLLYYRLATPTNTEITETKTIVTNLIKEDSI